MCSRLVGHQQAGWGVGSWRVERERERERDRKRGWDWMVGVSAIN